MSGDSSALEDTVAVELNAPATVSAGDNLEPIGKRPAGGATVARWVAYCVALGAGADGLTGMKRAALVDLADRLGG